MANEQGPKVLGEINKWEANIAFPIIKPLKGSDFYIPMNKDNIISINLKKNIVVINPIKGILN